MNKNKQDFWKAEGLNPDNYSHAVGQAMQQFSDLQSQHHIEEKRLMQECIDTLIKYIKEDHIYDEQNSELVRKATQALAKFRETGKVEEEPKDLTQIMVDHIKNMKPEIEYCNCAVCMMSMDINGECYCCNCDKPLSEM